MVGVNAKKIKKKIIYMRKPRKRRTHELDEHIKLIMMYFEFRNVQKFGYMNYGYFRSLIRYVLDYPDKKTVRRIFDILRYRHCFSIYNYGKTGNRKKYFWNPHQLKHEMHLMSYQVTYL